MTEDVAEEVTTEQKFGNHLELAGEGKYFFIKNTWLKNYISFEEDNFNKEMGVNYAVSNKEKEHAIAFEFIPYKDHKDIYLMKTISSWKGNKYISFGMDCHWLCQTDGSEEDAMPVRIIPKQEGGFEFIMRSYQGDQDNYYISFTDDGSWLREWYDNESDAMTFHLEQVALEDLNN